MRHVVSGCSRARVRSDVLQCVDHLLQFSAIVDCCKSFHILKDEHFRLFFSEVLDNVMDNITSSFLVFKTLTLSCHREGLTGKAGDVKVHGWNSFHITLGQVSIELIGFEVRIYHSFDMFISVRTESMLERNLEVPQSLYRCFNA